MYACRNGTRKLVTGLPWVAVGLLSLLAGGSSLAATINVPADQATITAAITAASPGDIIQVAPGTYLETIDINKPLILISSGGAGSTILVANVAATPAVKISVDGVAFGQADHGFRVDQMQNAPAVQIVGGQVGKGGVSVQGNNLRGTQSNYGVYVDAGVLGGVLDILNNNFTKVSGTYGFDDMIYVESTAVSSLGQNESLLSATVQINDNTGDNINTEGVYFSYYVGSSSVTINNNTLTGIAGSDVAIYFYYDVEDFSTVVANNNTLNNFDYGYYVDDPVENHSSFTVIGGSINNFGDEGLYIDDVEYSASLTIQNVTMAGDPSSASYGIDTYLYGSTMIVDNCNISNVDEYGIYVDDVDYDSTLSITNNTIAMVDTGSSGYGLYLYTEYGSTTTVAGNNISGFDYAGIYEDELYSGASLIVDHNIVTASAGGADYGIYVYGPEYGSKLVLTNNTFTNFDYAGMYVDYDEYGSSMTVTGNVFNALPTTGADYGIYVDDMDEDQATSTISDNQITGYNYAGAYIDYVEDGTPAIFSNNTLTAHPNGAEYGIYIEYVEDGASLTMDHNVVTGYGNQASSYGIYFYEIEDGATFILTNNVFTAHPAGSEYGLYSSDGFEYGCTGTINNNTFTNFTYEGAYIDYFSYSGSHVTFNNNTLTAASFGADYGIDLEYVEYGSTGEISNNVVTGFTETGIYIDDTYEGCFQTISGNTLTAGPASSSDQYGIYCDDYVEEGSTLVIEHNIITGLNKTTGDLYGMYIYEADDTGIVQILNNTVQAVSGGTGDGYGLYFYDGAYYGSTLEITGNHVAGFDYCGVYFDDDLDDGINLTMTDNRFTNGQYSVYFDSSYYIYDGSQVTVTGNVFEDFTNTGWDWEYTGDALISSHMSFDQNRFIGDHATAGYLMSGDVSGGSELGFTNNCFTGLTTAISINSVVETSSVTASGNDFSGATTAIKNVAGDALHAIAADGNYFGSATNSGEVKESNNLAAADEADSDGDGVPNCADDCPNTAAGASVDAHGCSCLQLNPTGDADGDGVLDCDDGCPNDPNKSAPGQCGCGTADTDTDGDGVADCVDGCPNDPAKTAPGQCGCGHADTDSDGDGVADCLDACPNDPAKTAAGACGCGVADTDSDGDGIPDCLDNCPNVANASQLDSNANGVGDACDTTGTCGFSLCGAGMATMLPLLLVTLLGMKRRRR